MELTDKCIQSININGEDIIVPDTKIINPFYISLVGSDVLNSKMCDIYSTYNSMYVLCLKENIKIDNELINIFYEQIIEKELLKKLMNYFILIKTNIFLLKSKKHVQLSNIIKKNFLDNYFPDYNFEVTEIVLPMLELKQSNIELYLSLYYNDKSYINFNKLLCISQYYNRINNSYVSNKVIDYINNIHKSFWEDEKNCNINMTDEFQKRIFSTKNIYKSNINNDDILAQITELLDNNISKNVNYFDEILDSNYVDISTTINNNKKSFYSKPDLYNINLTIETLTSLYTSIDDIKCKYYLINNILTSKDYCHLILNNKNLLELITPFFEKHKIIFKYTFAYGWISMYIEESLTKSKITTKDRFVFDLDTANKLPYFPICYEDIWQNPYVSFMVKNNLINLNKNGMSLYPIHDSDYYGVCTQKIFNNRFNIFCTGSKYNNLFEGLNWDNLAISGSIIPACVQKHSLLSNNIKVPGTSSINYNFFDFKNQYYTNSDIDLMCNKKKLLEFLEQATSVYNLLTVNIENIYNENATINIENIKTPYINISINSIKYLLDKLNNELGLIISLSDFKTKIKSKSDDVYEFLYDLYYSTKKQKNKILNLNKDKISEKYSISNEILQMYMKKSSIDDISVKFIKQNILKRNIISNDNETCYFVNDFLSPENKVSEDENFLVYKIYEPIRFKFTSSYLQHNIELFQVYNDNFFSIVNRFHFPCVRGYFQKDKVYLLPSAITAFMTGINIDYKYFSGTNDPVKIFNKYRSRGFGCILNNKEIKNVVYYNSNNNKESCYYTEKKSDVTESLLPKLLNDKIYKYKVTVENGECIKSSISVNNLSNIHNYEPDLKYIEQLKNTYLDNYNLNKPFVNMFLIKCINSEGSINKLSKWVIDGYWEIFGSTIDIDK